MKKLLILATLLATPAHAEQWATGRCVTQLGDKIDYIIHDGKGFISYNGSKPDPMFSEKKDNMGIITHIGNKGNMTLAVNLINGRGYYITSYDNGTKNESNVACKLGTIDK